MKEKKTRVLLVEDNPGDARLIQLHLADVEGDPFVVEHVDRLSSALDRLNRGGIDVVLLDLSLPDSQGEATFVRFCAMAPHIPVLILSGMRDDQVVIKALQEGVQDYLLKDHADRYAINHAICYAIERKRTQRLETDRKGLNDVIRAMEQVLGVIGHELRTPLTALRAISEVLIDGQGIGPDERDRYLKAINEQTLRMGDMIDQMLEVARIDSGRAKWNWSTIPLADTCESALDIIRPLIDPARIKLICDVSPADLPMKGDPDAVRRLLINLLSNSQKHTRCGEIMIKARSLRLEEAQWVELSVADTGIGIAPEVRSQLGRAFALNSGAADKHARGMGLGLAICRGIIQAHGGRISVASTPGKGTTFTLLLRSDLPGAIREGTEVIIQQAA